MNYCPLLDAYSSPLHKSRKRPTSYSGLFQHNAYGGASRACMYNTTSISSTLGSYQCKICNDSKYNDILFNTIRSDGIDCAVTLSG